MEIGQQVLLGWSGLPTSVYIFRLWVQILSPSASHVERKKYTCDEGWRISRKPSETEKGPAH